MDRNSRGAGIFWCRASGMAKDSQQDGREPSDAERRLWRFVTRNDQKLHPDDADAFDVDDYAAFQQALSPVPAPVVAKQRAPALPPHLLVCGDYAGVDKRSATRLRKGQLPIEVVVDLHGHNQIDAFEGLQDCVRHAVARHKRVILVITGKGREGEGVLRQSLPHWLNSPGIRPFVLAFDVANRKDGGDGAFYVLLKRQRAHG